MANANTGYGSFPRQINSRSGTQMMALGLIPCCNCCVAVPQDRFVAVEHFGSFKEMLGPGLSCAGFDCCGICIKFRSMSRRVEQNECIVETKTKDNVFVLIRVAVQQAVIPSKAEDAMYKLASVDSQIDAYVSDIVRSQVPNMLLDEAFEKKDAIGDAIRTELSREMATFGFEIRNALITEVKPQQDVMNAMNEINKQKRLRDAASLKAEANKIVVVKEAEAQRDAARLQGEGIAAQRSAIVDGLRSTITNGANETLTTQKISELLLITQYFETLKEVGANSKSNAIFIPHSPADGLTDIAAQIRNGVLTARASAPQQALM
eukprot:TRINITY_DN916_c0_g1_i10.p1 TRINITY_DN916_c0_g1~~TRINITY_DN916_c0_g1_i10.p1  ORF type:complete len:321 (+),score=65.63 TRINITY_DN916_c0_g1_i10:65-1027(+)